MSEITIDAAGHATAIGKIALGATRDAVIAAVTEELTRFPLTFSFLLSPGSRTCLEIDPSTSPATMRVAIRPAICSWTRA